jgi:hypothetical protein
MIKNAITLDNNDEELLITKIKQHLKMVMKYLDQTGEE